MRLYCTYCDHRYLPRALALLASMEARGFEGEFWLFCLSDECFRILSLLNLSRIRAVRLSELEAQFPELLAVKPARETIEYYYTCSPAIVAFALARRPDAESVTFLDSDLWFFQSPDRVFDAIGAASVAIIPHNFVPRLRHLERFGRFNLGWVSFRNDAEGVGCLEWWRARCIEWCYGVVDDGRYADQGYLDRFPELAPHTKILTHKGCNLAPWNIENYEISLRDGELMVDEQPLLFFHFSGLQKGERYVFDSHRSYGAQHSRIIRDFIYKPYVQALLDAETTLERLQQYMGTQAVAPRGGMQIAGIDLKNLARDARRRYFQAVDLAQGWPIVIRGRRAT
jgi:hypothetical protein